MNPNWRRVVCAAVFSACSALQLHAQVPERLWYYVDREDAWNSLQRNIAKISVLAPSSYGVDEQGVVWGDVDAKVLELAKRSNVRVMPLLVNTGFEQEPLHRFLANPEARKRAIQSLVEL